MVEITATSSPIWSTLMSYAYGVAHDTSADVTFLRSGCVFVALLLLIGIFALIRHVLILRRRRQPMVKAWKAAKQGAVPDASKPQANYVVYVLGSGGHTGELCEMIRQQFRPNSLSHRRYIITSGDTHSQNAVDRLEAGISVAVPGVDAAGRPLAGSWDVVHVVRARKVHQSLWSVWYTSALSAFSILMALLRPPRPPPDDRENKQTAATATPTAIAFGYPQLVVTNGPGTGFIVGLVAHLMKIFCFVPSNRLCILYIETWAHVSTLSLTGKLFHYSRIADLFVVQHRLLAQNTGARFVGDVAKYGNLLGIKKTFAPASSARNLRPG